MSHEKRLPRVELAAVTIQNPWVLDDKKITLLREYTLDRSVSRRKRHGGHRGKRRGPEAGQGARDGPEWRYLMNCAARSTSPASGPHQIAEQHGRHGAARQQHRARARQRQRGGRAVLGLLEVHRPHDARVVVERDDRVEHADDRDARRRTATRVLMQRREEVELADEARRTAAARSARRGRSRASTARNGLRLPEPAIGGDRLRAGPRAHRHHGEEGADVHEAGRSADRA